MAVLNLRLQLLNHVNSLFEEGLLNEQFRQYELLQDAHSHNAGLMTRSITAFFDGVEKHLVEVESILNGDDVDFTTLCHTMFKMWGSSAIMGAQNMKHAVRPLIQRCKANDKDGCMELLQKFKCEYQNIKGRLEKIVQLESIILQYEQN